MGFLKRNSGFYAYKSMTFNEGDLRIDGSLSRMGKKQKP